MAAKPNRPSIKDRIRDVLADLPDDCTEEDVQCQLYLIEKINRSEASLARKGGISHAKVKRRVASWLSRRHAPRAVAR
jgi:hypothetical protein